MKSKRIIIIGAVLVVCAIILGGLYILSGAVRFDNQLKLGNKYLLEGNYEEAILAFEKAIQIESKSVDARLGLAEAYVAVDRADDAIAVLEEAMGIDPKRPEPYINLAKIYISRNELEKAIEILEAGMKNSGDAGIAALLVEIKPKAPKASVESGEYAEAITATFEGIAENDEVYYTLDNTAPNRDGTKYSEPISLTNGSHVLRAITCRDNGIASEEARYEYQIEISKTPAEIAETEPYKLFDNILLADEITLGGMPIWECTLERVAAAFPEGHYNQADANDYIAEGFQFNTHFSPVYIGFYKTEFRGLSNGMSLTDALTTLGFSE